MSTLEVRGQYVVKRSRNLVRLFQHAQRSRQQRHLLLRLGTANVEEDTINEALLIVNEELRDLALVRDGRLEDGHKLRICCSELVQGVSWVLDPDVTLQADPLSISSSIS